MYIYGTYSILMDLSKIPNVPTAKRTRGGLRLGVSCWSTEGWLVGAELLVWFEGKLIGNRWVLRCLQVFFGCYFFLGNYLKKPNFRWSFETDSGKTTWFDQLWALTTIARWEVPEQCPQSHWPSVFVELCLGCKGSPLRIPHPQIETFQQKLDHFNYKDQRQLLGLAKSIYLQLRENWDRFHSRVWVRWNSCFWISFWENKLFWASHKLLLYGLWASQLLLKKC